MYNFVSMEDKNSKNTHSNMTHNLYDVINNCNAASDAALKMVTATLDAISKLNNTSCLLADLTGSGKLLYRSNTLLYIDDAAPGDKLSDCPNLYWGYTQEDVREQLIRIMKVGISCARNFSAQDYQSHVCHTDFPIFINGKKVFIHQKFTPILVQPNGTIEWGLFIISTSTEKKLQSFIENRSGETWEYNSEENEYIRCKSRFHITPKELSVLRCLVQRMSSEEIAEKLHMCPNTVKTHKRNIYNKLDAHSKDEVIIIAHNYHLI